ncbi:MAG: ROK family protein [Planctomycetota bacterium]|jgi:glucokinase
MTAGKSAIGIDLGGTRIKATLITGNKASNSPVDIATESDKGVEHVLNRISDLVQAICEVNGIEPASLAGIGIASPGPMDPRQGIIINAVNLPGWKNIPLREEVARRTGRPASLINDANAACFGEYRLGAGKGCDDVVLLTLGTGIGGGVISQGSLLIGHHGNAGEFGHTIVNAGGRICNCGQHGCLEAYAGGRALAELAVAGDVCDLTEKDKVLALVNSVKAGHPEGTRIWKESCEALSVACVNIFHSFNPGVILLGGGVSAAGDMLLKPVSEQFANLLWSLSDQKPEIRTAVLGRYAGAIGAAAWFLHGAYH